jgi:hypothetical protein
MKKRSMILSLLFLTWVLPTILADNSSVDPPARVARLNYLSGSVSFQPSGLDEWAPASLNYPMTTGDQLWVDSNSRTELHIGSTAIHLNSSTAFAFLNLDDRTVQIRLSQGSVNLHIRYLSEDELFEVDTPDGAITLLRIGEYRIDSDPDRNNSTITVRGGEAEITAGSSAFPVHAGQSAVGGSHRGVSFAMGGGGVGWFPLAPREAYYPAYHVSPAYVMRINETHVTNITNINYTTISTTNVKYVNQTVPGAVTAVSKNDFVSARQVAQARMGMPTKALTSAPVVGMAPPVTPRSESLLARPVDSPAAVPRPPQATLSRPVLAIKAPPPPPVPFAAREQALTASPGRPLDTGTLANLRANTPVRQPLVQPVTSQRGSGPADTTGPKAPAEKLERPASSPVRQAGPRPGQQAPGARLDSPSDLERQELRQQHQVEEPTRKAQHQQIETKPQEHEQPHGKGQKKVEGEHREQKHEKKEGKPGTHAKEK